MPGMVTERPILRGERVWLRPVETSDIMGTSLDDVELAHYAGFRRGFSRVEGERFAQHLAAQGEGEPNFAICPLGEDRSIGSCGLRDVDRTNGSAEVSIFITAREDWSKGYGTDAMAALLDFAFGALRLERVWLRVFDYNERAVRSYEKAGFVTEARLRHDRYHRGVHHDVFLMAIVRPDWEALDRKHTWDY
jgi:RimJ/RimL family protein N-acetyltransferase